MFCYEQKVAVGKPFFLIQFFIGSNGLNLHIEANSF